MNNLFWISAASLCMLVGGIACYQSRRATSRKVRLRLIKVAIGAFGSLAIVGLVGLLAELLQLVVILIAITWLARHLWHGTSPVVRFIEKRFPQSA
jgi:hypothetical protein